jgi:hypothetical protein
MTRLYVDPVEVRTRTEAAGPVPEQFLWRGRLYLVREVLARWTASGPWWQSASPVADDMEQEWWRVEASSGRLAALSGGSGIFDLCFCWGSGTWSLQRVID